MHFFSHSYTPLLQQSHPSIVFLSHHLPVKELQRNFNITAFKHQQILSYCDSTSPILNINKSFSHFSTWSTFINLVTESKSTHSTSEKTVNFLISTDKKTTFNPFQTGLNNQLCHSPHLNLQRKIFILQRKNDFTQTL